MNVLRDFILRHCINLVPPVDSGLNGMHQVGFITAAYKSYLQNISYIKNIFFARS